ncbi:MAG TPA: hypothetical protein VI854_03315 [Acidimicrobiia bacterium]|nr:hypothetical protein [Acidimicrobiia bacterium]
MGTTGTKRVISARNGRYLDEMITHRRAPLSSTWTVLAVVVATLAVTSGPAWANHTSYSVPENKLGFSACSWAPGRVITVAADPAFPFPDAAFSARLDDTIRRWNEVLTSTNRQVGMARVDGAADVLVQYRPTDTADAHDVLGETYLQREGDSDLSPNIGRCPDRQATTFTMQAAQIRINPRSDWFTGDDQSTGLWEMCDGESFRATNQALCSSRVDFASTMVHEIGHALVLYHPQTLDDIDGIPAERGDSASSQARCVEAAGSFGAQATLCAGQGVWRTEQRTLETWDVETTHRQYN